MRYREMVPTVFKERAAAHELVMSELSLKVGARCQAVPCLVGGWCLSLFQATAPFGEEFVP